MRYVFLFLTPPTYVHCTLYNNNNLQSLLRAVGWSLTTLMVWRWNTNNVYCQDLRSLRKAVDWTLKSKVTTLMVSRWNSNNVYCQDLRSLRKAVAWSLTTLMVWRWNSNSVYYQDLWNLRKLWTELYSNYPDGLEGEILIMSTVRTSGASARLWPELQLVRWSGG